MALSCTMCGCSTYADTVDDCRYVANHEPCCSQQCYRAAVSLDRFDKGIVVMPYKSQGELPFLYDSEPFPDS